MCVDEKSTVSSEDVDSVSLDENAMDTSADQHLDHSDALDCSEGPRESVESEHIGANDDVKHQFDIYYAHLANSFSNGLDALAVSVVDGEHFVEVSKHCVFMKQTFRHVSTRSGEIFVWFYEYLSPIGCTT